MKCRNCGTSIPAHARFCPSCGLLTSSYIDFSEEYHPIQPTFYESPVKKKAEETLPVSDMEKTAAEEAHSEAEVREVESGTASMETETEPASTEDVQAAAGVEADVSGTVAEAAVGEEAENSEAEAGTEDAKTEEKSEAEVNAADAGTEETSEIAEASEEEVAEIKTEETAAAENAGTAEESDEASESAEETEAELTEETAAENAGAAEESDEVSESAEESEAKLSEETAETLEGEEAVTEEVKKTDAAAEEAEEKETAAETADHEAESAMEAEEAGESAETEAKAETDETEEEKRSEEAVVANTVRGGKTPSKRALKRQKRKEKEALAKAKKQEAETQVAEAAETAESENTVGTEVKDSVEDAEVLEGKAPAETMAAVEAEVPEPVESEKAADTEVKAAEMAESAVIPETAEEAAPEETSEDAEAGDVNGSDAVEALEAETAEQPESEVMVQLAAEIEKRQQAQAAEELAFLDRSVMRRIRELTGLPGREEPTETADGPKGELVEEMIDSFDLSEQEARALAAEFTSDEIREETDAADSRETGDSVAEEDADADAVLPDTETAEEALKAAAKEAQAESTSETESAFAAAEAAEETGEVTASLENEEAPAGREDAVIIRDIRSYRRKEETDPSDVPADSDEDLSQAETDRDASFSEPEASEEKAQDVSLTDDEDTDTDAAAVIDFSDGVEKLTEEAPEEEDLPAPTPEEVKKSFKKNRGWLLPVGAAVVGVCAAVAYMHTPSMLQERSLKNGRRLVESADYEAAIPVLEQLMAGGTESQELYLLLSDAYGNSGRHEEAVALLQEAEERYPEDAALAEKLRFLNPLVSIELTPEAEAGVYTDPVEISLSNVDNFKIYYTITGSENTAESSFAAPITLSLNGEYDITASAEAVDGARGPAMTAKVVVSLDPEKYHLNDWADVDGGKAYIAQNGARVTGWQEIDGSRYYFDEDGILQTGLVTLDQDRYLFDEAGEMLTGWQEAEGNRYFFDSDGKMLKSTWIDESYYVGDDGAMLRDTEVDGVYLDATGARSFLASREYESFPNTLVHVDSTSRVDEGDYFTVSAKVYHSMANGRPSGDADRDITVKLSKSAWLDYLDGDLISIQARDAVKFLPDLYMQNIQQDEEGVITRFSMLLGENR